jgi:hypothetical protein
MISFCADDIYCRLEALDVLRNIVRCGTQNHMDAVVNNGVVAVILEIFPCTSRSKVDLYGEAILTFLGRIILNGSISAVEGVVDSGGVATLCTFYELGDVFEQIMDWLLLLLNKLSMSRRKAVANIMVKLGYSVKLVSKVQSGEQVK